MNNKRNTRKNMPMLITSLVIFILAVGTASASEVTITPCQWNGPGTIEANGICNHQDGCSLEVTDNGTDWATVECAVATCSTFFQPGCIGFGSDGLVHAAFETSDDHGGFIRGNGEPTYEAFLIVSPSNSGTTWPFENRDVLNDTTDLQSLQDDHKVRVMEIRWAKTGIGLNPTFTDLGKFARTEQGQDQSILDVGQRDTAIIKYVESQINPNQNPVGVLGASAGASASLSPLLLDDDFADTIEYLGLFSIGGYDFYQACNGATPPTYYINPQTGVLLVAAGPYMDDVIGEFMDYVWNIQTDGCVDDFGTLSESQVYQKYPQVANSSSGLILTNNLNAGASGYNGVLQMGVGTNNTQHPIVGDNEFGITWASGNLYNHAYFSGATKSWHECTLEGHGGNLRQESVCFDDVYNKIVATLT